MTFATSPLECRNDKNGLFHPIYQLTATVRLYGHFDREQVYNKETSQRYSTLTLSLIGDHNN